MKIENNISLDQIAELFKKAKKILILGHMNIDGDCLGSMFASKLVFSNLAKKITVVSKDKLPDIYSYLNKYGELENINDFSNFDLILILDSSNLTRTSYPELLKESKNKVPILLIDHHLKSDLLEFVDFYFINPKAAATSQILFDLFSRMKIKIDKDIATCLLTGLVTDTGNFQYQNTTSETLKVASELIKRGGRLGKVVKNAFLEKPMNTLKLWGRAMERLQFNKEYKTIFTYLTYKDILECKVNKDASSGIVNFLNSIKGVKILFFLVEQEPGEIKVSLRTPSKKVNLKNLASVFGGGGHPGAAGFLLKGSIVEKDNNIKII